MSAVRAFRWMTLAAGVAALATFGVLGIQVANALGANPNVLLLGVEGPQSSLSTQSSLITLAWAAGLLAVGVVVWALKYRHLLRASLLVWFASAAAIGYVTAGLELSGYLP
jgi:hypothetical protein